MGRVHVLIACSRNGSRLPLGSSVSDRWRGDNAAYGTYGGGVRLGRKPQLPTVVHTVTSAPMSVAEDTDMRMRRYLITMGIRIVCFVLAVVFEGWLRWVFVAGATILPYIAVVLANAVGPKWGSRITAVDKYEAPYAGLHASAPASGPVITHDAHQR